MDLAALIRYVIWDIQQRLTCDLPVSWTRIQLVFSQDMGEMERMRVKKLTQLWIKLLVVIHAVKQISLWHLETFTTTIRQTPSFWLAKFNGWLGN